MNQALLLDGIVRETARLVATLATTGHSSVSVGHLADLFFITLADDLLDHQGRSQKVVADLFQLPLRTFRYRLKTMRESATQRGQTLWRVVFDHVRSAGPVSQVDVEQRFAREDQKVLWSILRDMVDSGLVFQSGSGRHRRYLAVGEPRFDPEESDEADAHMLWVAVYTHPRSTAAELADAIGAAGSAVQTARLDAALARLLDEGRVVMIDDDTDGDPRYESAGFDLQPDPPEGPFAAAYDHFRAVVSTLRARITGDADRDRCGGSTFRFEVWDGHPSAPEVDGMLVALRRQMGDLIERVDAIAPPPDAVRRRTLVYFGQSTDRQFTSPSEGG